MPLQNGSVHPNRNAAELRQRFVLDGLVIKWRYNTSSHHPTGCAAMELLHHPETQPERQIPSQLQVARLPIPPVPLWPVPPDGRRYDAVRRGSLLPSFCQKTATSHQPGGAGIELCPSRGMGRLRQECRRQVSAADAFGRAGVAKRHAGSGRPVDANLQWAYRIDGQKRLANCEASQ